MQLFQLGFWTTVTPLYSKMLKDNAIKNQWKVVRIPLIDYWLTRDIIHQTNLISIAAIADN